MRVLLLAGAWSPEAEVSLKGAVEIKKALEERGHEVTLANPSECFDNLIDMAKLYDVSFINIHGTSGEDGLIQAMLEHSGRPFQGSSASASILALHKATAKQLFRRAGIKTADWHFLPSKPQTGWKPDFDFPIFAKSNTGGSSLCVAKIDSLEELESKLLHLFSQAKELIIEPMIQGIELSCGVLDIKGEVKALPPVLIKPKNGTFFDYKNKYAVDGAEEICPAPLPLEIEKEVKETALKAHEVLTLSGYSRSDFILTPQNELFILETNTIPGMTSKSLLPLEASVLGYSFADLVEILLESAMKKAITSTK